MEENYIIECKIEEGKWDNRVLVKYVGVDGWECIGSYYPDELYFSEAEFRGLTKREARDLMHQKDVAYLRS